MTIRTMAGLGMILMAAGLLVIFFLVPRLNDRAPETPTSEPTAVELPSVVENRTGGPEQVADFLTDYNANYRSLWTDREAARWSAAVDIKTENFQASAEAARKLAGYVGSRTIIEKLRLYRDRSDLSSLQEKQLEMAWQLAAYFPGTIPATVDQLLEAESSLATALFNCSYMLPDSGGQLQPVTLQELEALLATNRDPDVRRSAWKASMQPGPLLKDDLVEMRLLRNAAAREMGYSSYFALRCADYGLTSAEMIAWLDELMVQLQPLYEQLHCWARHRLAARFVGEEAPSLMPAHWLPRRWGDSWPGMATQINLDGIFVDSTPQSIIEQAEKFCTSLGFDPLPVTFWDAATCSSCPRTPAASRAPRPRPGISTWIRTSVP